MSYVLQRTLSLNPDQTDPAQLSAVLQTHGGLDSALLPAVTATLVNDADTFYFKQLDTSFFSFYNDAWPAGFRGCVLVKYAGVVVAVFDVNPEEIELVNAAVTPVASGRVQVWDKAEDLEGNPVAGVRVTAELVDLPGLSSTGFLTAGKQETVSGSDGKWSFDLPAGNYTFNADALGIENEEATVPAIGPVQYRTIRPS